MIAVREDSTIQHNIFLSIGTKILTNLAVLRQQLMSRSSPIYTVSSDRCIWSFESGLKL